MRTYMVNVEGLDDTREAVYTRGEGARLVRRFAENSYPVTPTEHKTVQARILAYVQEIG